jgi:hypothetical protein
MALGESFGSPGRMACPRRIGDAAVGRIRLFGANGPMVRESRAEFISHVRWNGDG